MEFQKGFDHRRDIRQRVECPGEFFIDADIFKARSMDLSESGIRLQLQKPVQIVMRLQVGMSEMDRLANLVWARRNSNGQMEYGLEYLPDLDEEEDMAPVCSPS